MPTAPAETDPQLTPRQQQLTRWTIAVLVLPLLLILFHWGDIPERVPIHFNAAGEADGWGGRGSIFLLPFILGGTTLLMLLVARNVSAKDFNIPFQPTEQNAAEHYRLARGLLIEMSLAIALSGAYLSWETLQVALGRQAGLSSLALPLVLAAVFLPLGYYFWRARRIE